MVKNIYDYLPTFIKYVPVGVAPYKKRTTRVILSHVPILVYF